MHNHTHTHTQTKGNKSMCSYVQLNKHIHLKSTVARTRTHTRTHMLSWDVSQNPSPVPSVRCWALQPQGEAPASSPARAGQAEHLAPRRGHRHRPTHPSAPVVLLGVKEASPTASSPLCQASPRVTQAPGLDSPHSLKRLKAELQHFAGGYFLQLLVSSAVRARGFLFHSGSTH